LTKAPLFDPVRDIAMVSMVSSYPFIVNVNPASPFRSFAELLAYARANPGKLNYASSGIGSIGHLSSELLNVMAGTEIVHIPTKGGNVALTELLAGRIDFLLEAPTLSLPYIQSGKLRALAATGKERSKTLADLPTVAESLPGYEVISFIGLGVTNGTPEPIVAQLSAEMKKIIDQPDTAKRLQDLGGEPQASTPEEMKRFVEQEFRKWRKVVDVRKIEAL
jgi:tripartite-type tricarboxylate transporter receptor subunit TctC